MPPRGFASHALLWTLSLGAAGCRCEPSTPPPPPPAEATARGVALEVVATDLDEPIGLVHAPGDASRVFVVEKPGRVRVLRDGQLLPQPYLDVTSRVTSRGSEQGLLGLAFHPRHAETRLAYINYTDPKGETRVLEIRTSKDDADRADLAGAREILFVDQPYSNHNGGDLAFGRDGKLYVGLGDGGKRDDPHGNGQDPKALLGKMLRIDVDASGDGAPPVEILMLGLRNPWRYSFDRATGDLYIADVGQDKWEEVHVVPAGAIGGQNFGWNVLEGNHCLEGDTCRREGFVPAVLEYDHSTGCSITGGYVYRGRALPTLAGHYFYSDHCTAILRSFRFRDGRAEEPTDWKPTLDPGSKLSKIASFGEDADGELYIASQSGTVYKLVPAPSRRPP